MLRWQLLVVVGSVCPRGGVEGGAHALQDLRENGRSYGRKGSVKPGVRGEQKRETNQRRKRVVKGERTEV